MSIVGAEEVGAAADSAELTIIVLVDELPEIGVDSESVTIPLYWKVPVAPVWNVYTSEVPEMPESFLRVLCPVMLKKL